MEKEYNEKRINPPFWQHDSHVLKRLYYILQWITQKYFQKKEGMLIDYGCGSSPYKKLFLPIIDRYIAVDIDENKDADIIVEKNKTIPLKNESAKILLSTQVLEHVADVDFYLGESRRLLEKKGLLILSTHGIWPYHPYPSDYHRWTRKGLEKTLQNEGFKVLEVFPILGPFASVTQFTLILIAERLLNKGLIFGLILKIISLVGNGMILLEDKLFPATDLSDASLFVICAKKI